MKSAEEHEMFVTEEKLEYLREKLNKEIIKYIEHTNTLQYEKILDLSKKLDDVIVDYIKISNTINIRNRIS